MQKIVLSGTQRQMLLSMKFIALFLFLVGAQALARVKSQSNITYSAKNAPIEKVLSAIKEQSNYVFFYTYGALDKAKPVTLNVKNAGLKQVLDICFSNQPLTYTIKDKTVLIQEKPSAASPSDFFTYNPLAVQNVVHGRVTDSSGTPLGGVSVIIQSTRKGTITDDKGEYNLQVNAGDVLEFSFIGYRDKYVTVGQNAEIDVQLYSTTASLGDIVIVGYGTERKSAVTAAISTLDGKDISNKPVVNMSNSLIGRVPGVITTQGSGEPGFDGASIHIRGVSTTGNNAPLVIVDGIPRDFSQLDPNDVQSVTVLKDAAAVAPYGVAGANGVILVTTKKGAAGAPTITYNGYAGMQAPTRVPKMVNSYEYAQMRNEANKNDGNPPAYSDYDLEKFKDGTDPDGHPNSQPFKQVIRPNSLLTYHNFTLSGGTDKVKYFASAGYTYQAGMWSTDYSKKYNASFSLQAKVTKTTEVDLSATGWEQDGYYPTYSAAFMLGQAFRTPPTSAVYYSNGLWGSYIGQSLVGEMFHSGKQEDENTTMQTQISIEQQLPFIKGLSIKGVAAYDPTKNFTTIWNVGPVFYNVDTSVHPYTYAQGQQDNPKPTYSEGYNQNKALTYQVYLNYHNTFGKNDVTALAVAESRQQNYYTFGAARANYSLDLPGLDYGSSDPTDITNTGSNSQATQVGYVYRVAYGYSGKYLLEASGRYDGNYYFAPGKKYGYFPAFSAGWVLSEEPFIKNHLPWIDNLKIRGSWGESGNLAGSAFQYLSAYGLYGNSAVLDGNATSGLYEIVQGNPNITWEKAKKADVGLEASLWKNALNFEADYFYEKRSNMLLTPATTVSNEYGIGLSEVNAGIMSNQGIDLSINGAHSFSDNWRLEVTGTFTYAQNKLIQTFETAATYNNPNRRRTGRPLGTQFGLKALGYYTASDFNSDGSLKSSMPTPTWGAVQPGDLRYADLSGPNGKPDGVIDSYDETHIGDPVTPAIVYSLEPHISFKNFDLDVLLQGTGMQDMSLYSTIVWPFYSSSSATLLEYEDHWTPDNANALYPRLSGTPTSNNTQNSSWWIRNSSYIRLKSLEFGYTLPATIIKRLGIHSARFFISAQNLWTWTPSMKEEVDPESQNSQATDYFDQRVISLGANITL